MSKDGCYPHSFPFNTLYMSHKLNLGCFQGGEIDKERPEINQISEKIR